MVLSRFFTLQVYSTAGRDHPSVCESLAASERMTNIPLHRISEECASVFSGSITNEHMLDYIVGENSCCKNENLSEVVIDSGFDANRGHNQTLSSSGPDHYMLDEQMIRATPNRVMQQEATVSTNDHPTNTSCSDDDDSIVSIVSSSDCNSNGCTKVEHPDHYATIKQDNIVTVSDNQMSSEMKEVPADDQHSDYIP